VPVDGVLVEGRSRIDVSMLTGESMPVEKMAGDNGIGATINHTGTFVFRATNVGSDPVLAQIVRLVEEAQGSKVPMQRLADRIASIVVPIVAVLTFAIWLIAGPSPALSYVIPAVVTVLVIACPCAIELSCTDCDHGGNRQGSGAGHTRAGWRRPGDGARSIRSCSTRPGQSQVESLP